MAIIEIKSLNKSFQNNHLFENANFTIEEGKTVGLVGQNASGKSVLFRMIAGLEKVDQGEILVRNQKVGPNLDYPNNLGYFVNQAGYIEIYDGLTNLKLLAEIQGKIGEDQI